MSLNEKVHQADHLTAKITVDGKQVAELPVLEGAVGPRAIDVRSLYRSTGMFTHDPGFMSTSSCESSITYIDGEEGILRHRGYDIADLAENCEYLDVVHLLFYGDLPNAEERESFLRPLE